MYMSRKPKKDLKSYEKLAQSYIRCRCTRVKSVGGGCYVSRSKSSADEVQSFVRFRVISADYTRTVKYVRVIPGRLKVSTRRSHYVIYTVNI